MVTVVFLKFPLQHIPYALSQMQFAHKILSKVKGCNFYKLMGSGAGNGFSILPDLRTFCLLMQWEDIKSQLNFFKNHKFWKSYSSKAKNTFVLELQPTKVRGSWDGQNPFSLSEKGEERCGKIAVLTRATIKKRYIPYFWSQVPKASAPVKKTIGHLFSKGVGELPLFLQATISIWESKEAMYNYAYRNPAHVEMIKKTREKDWYKEELFTEFSVISVMGSL